jgi:succinoglycan biosynthesis transport protein ExoP
VSKYFELLQRAGHEIDTREGLQPATVEIEPRVHRDPAPRPVNSDNEMPDWLRAVAILVRHWRLSVLFAASVMTTVTVVTFLLKPVYEPTARIEVDPPGEVFSLEQNGGMPTDAEYLETQAQNLRSDHLAIDIIRSMRLDQVRELAGIPKPANAVASSDPSLGSVQLSPAEANALENFREALKVRRDTASRLILISFASHDPRLAAQVANTVAETFIDDTFRTRHEAITKSSEWLARQLDDIRVKMESSTLALAQFQRSIGVTEVDENKSTYSEHMSELNHQLTQAEAERIQLQAMLKSVQNDDPVSLPDVRNNPVVQQLSQKLAEQRSELSQALVVYGKNHPSARKLQSQVDQLQTELNAQQRAILNSVKASYAAAEAKQRLMEGELRGTTKQLDQLARYAALKKEVQTNVDLYNSLYTKIKEAGITAASKSGNMRIVDPARILNTPTRPRRMLNLIIGLLVAVLGGVVLAFIREQFDNRLHTPQDIIRWIGNANVAVIPAMEEDGMRKGLRERLLTAKQLDNDHTSAFILDRPHSPESEALHSLQASLMFAQPGTRPQVLMLVSSFSGEGKSTVALNLALALSRQGETCLVDSDLRKGKISSRFGMRSKLGMAEFLDGSASLEEVVHVSSVPNVSVVPAGTPRANPGQLICSPNARELFRALRSRFRFVIVDSVPVIPFADGRALAPLADALIFVSRAGVTTREAMRRSLQMLDEIHAAPVIEFVLNGADVQSADYAYYQQGYTAYGS